MKGTLHLLTAVLFTAGLFAQTPRLSLLEEFTGENCGPCALVNPGSDANLAKPLNRKRVVPLKWQAPIPTAPTNTWSLYQTNKTEINWRYRSTANGGYGYNNGAGITSAPNFLYDGWINAGPATTSDCATAQSYTSAFSITMEREWDLTQSSVNLTVNIQATANFNAVGNLVFRTVMTERKINFLTPPGSNGETEFHDVAIRSFPSLQGGTAMAGNWVPGQTQTFTLNCPLPSYTRKKEEVAFVGFIQDDGNRKVAQAVRAEKQGIGLNDAELVSMESSPGIICNGGSVPRVVLIRNNGTNTITDFTVTPYVDAVAQTPVTWSGTLTNGAYKTLTLTPYVPIAGGGHTLSCKITGVSGGDSDLLNNEAAITFYYGNNAISNQVTEGFTGNFPPVNWAILNPDQAVTWKTGTVGGFGLSTESSFYEAYLNERGGVDDLLLPPLNLSGNAAPDMTFDVAYAQRMGRSDTLEVLASSDCGNSWSLMYRKQNSTLVTYTYNYVATYFTPASSDWRKETIALTGFNQPEVLVKFRVKNDAGNNIYVDNVNVTQSQPVGLHSHTLNNDHILIYPNPTNGFIQAKIESKKSSPATFTLLNTTGQVVLVENETLKAGTNAVELNLEELSTGFYYVVITTGDETVVKKLSIVK